MRKKLSGKLQSLMKMKQTFVTKIFKNMKSSNEKSKKKVKKRKVEEKIKIKRLEKKMGKKEIWQQNLEETIMNKITKTNRLRKIQNER